MRTRSHSRIGILGQRLAVPKERKGQAPAGTLDVLLSFDVYQAGDKPLDTLMNTINQVMALFK